MLIGETGSDHIIGHTIDDMLVAAGTAYDDDQQTLWWIIAEWTTGNSFQDRVNNVHYGTGSLFRTGVKLEGKVTDDDSEGVLTGSRGDDWYIWNNIYDRVTDLYSTVLEEDLDWLLNA